MPVIKNSQPVYEYSKRTLLLVFAVYFFCICLAAWHSFKKPEYNWDMLAYMALAVKMEHKDAETIHNITYKSARENIPAGSYQLLTDSSNRYRKKMSENAVDFYRQLPFYIVKPLYSGLVYIFYKAGFSLPASTVLPSVFAYLFTAVLLWHWLKKYIPIFYATAVGLLVMLSAPMLTVARMSTPDFVSAFLLFSAVYFIVERPGIIPMFIFMAASVFTRIDNIIPCACILSLLFFTGKWERKVSAREYAGMLLLLVICYFLVTFQAGSYGWNVLYYPSFAHYLNISRDFHAAFSWSEYLRVIYADGVTGMYHSHIAIFFLLALSLFFNRPPGRFSNLGFDQLFSLSIILVILVRFILDPDISDRFYIPYYLMIFIFFVRMITGRDTIQNQQ